MRNKLLPIFSLVIIGSADYVQGQDSQSYQFSDNGLFYNPYDELLMTSEKRPARYKPESRKKANLALTLSSEKKLESEEGWMIAGSKKKRKTHESTESSFDVPGRKIQKSAGTTQFFAKTTPRAENKLYDQYNLIGSGPYSAPQYRQYYRYDNYYNFKPKSFVPDYGRYIRPKKKKHYYNSFSYHTPRIYRNPRTKIWEEAFQTLNSYRKSQNISKPSGTASIQSSANAKQLNTEQRITALEKEVEELKKLLEQKKD